MRIRLSKLRKIIRHTLQESSGTGSWSEAQRESQRRLRHFVDRICDKLGDVPYRDHARVADEMSGGRYSSDPEFQEMVDEELQERESWSIQP